MSVNSAKHESGDNDQEFEDGSWEMLTRLFFTNEV